MNIEVLKKSLFAHNDRAAERNRSLLDEHGVVAVNVMGGAGCGKTTLLEQVLPRLRPEVSVAVLEGDIATTRDADRIAALGVAVIQLLTEGGCHLTATLVGEGLRRLPLTELDLLIIENVGNPICPANFDLGAHARVAVLSTAEGDDKPAKYPYLFKIADLVVLTKMDLKGACGFDENRAISAIQALDPGKEILKTSKHDHSSFDPLVEWMKLRSHLLGVPSIA